MNLRLSLIVVVALMYTHSFISCGEKVPEVNDAELRVDSISLTTIDDKIIYFNYNINRLIIDAIAENDGLTGIKYKLRLKYPAGVNPISTVPDLSQPINFSAGAVKVIVNYTKTISKEYIVSVKELDLDPAKLIVSDITVLTSGGSNAGFALTKSGSDYIALTQNPANTQYKLQFKFPTNINPISILPDPNIARDYSKMVTFDVKYTDAITKKYTVTIGNFNPNANQLGIIRGVWLTNVASDVLRTNEGIKECARLCNEIGINTIFMVTYNNSKTMYRSDVMKEYFGFEIDPIYGTRDPLREMIDAAKPYGIKVIAWFEYGFASVYDDRSGGAIIGKYPQWASRDIAGNITEKNKFYWLDAFNPDVQNYMCRLMKEVVTKYPDLDGVQGDDRLPALPSNGGYNKAVTDAYKAETGKDAPSNYLDAAWLKWRANKLSDFGTYLHKSIKAINPKSIVSLSPSPYSWSLENYLQDSPEWVRREQVDYLHPQLYRNTFDAYKASFDQAFNFMAFDTKRAQRLNPGVLIGVGSGESITPAILDDILAYNRSKGINGETFFYYERIRQNKGFQDVIKKYNK